MALPVNFRLEVSLPGDITETDLIRPAMANTWVASAIGRAECAFSSYIMFDDNADVWWRGIGFQSGLGEYRERPTTDPTCGRSTTSYGWYVPMQVARSQNEKTHAALLEWTAQEVPERDNLLVTTATYTGYIYQHLGEVMCELAVDVGKLMTPDEVQQRAETWFTTALEQVSKTGDFSTVATSSVRQMALLGRARARYARGDLAGAAADAAQIQPGFIAWILRDNSELERRNTVWEAQGVATLARPIQHPWADAANRKVIPFTGYYDFGNALDEAGRPVVIPLAIDPSGRNNVNQFPVFGSTPESVPDPRVRAEATSRFTVAGSVRVVTQQKYPAADSPMPLARWAEAQFILAEFEGGQAAVNRINALRDVHGLPHYTVPNPTAKEIEDLIIEERRREFFLEGRFYATKIRKNLWFPDGEGTTPTGYRYQVATCMLMPESEYDLNPNL